MPSMTLEHYFRLCDKLGQQRHTVTHRTGSDGKVRCFLAAEGFSLEIWLQIQENTVIPFSDTTPAGAS